MAGLVTTNGTLEFRNHKRGFCSVPRDKADMGKRVRGRGQGELICQPCSTSPFGVHFEMVTDPSNSTMQ